MQLNHGILRFWDHAAEHCGDDAILHKVPKFIKEPPPPNARGRCIFVGLNPSFVAGPPGGDLKAWLDEHPALATYPYPDVFNWRNPYIDWPSGAQNYEQVQAAVEAMAQLHHDARNWYPWFDRLNVLAEAMNIPKDDYVHLDMYLWLAMQANQVAQGIALCSVLARRQECLFLELLDRLHPEAVLCLYPRVARAIDKLCEKNAMGFWRNGDWQPVENAPRLRQVKIYRLGNQKPITLFKPVGCHIPTGRMAMNNLDFETVIAFFHAHFQNP